MTAAIIVLGIVAYLVIAGFVAERIEQRDPAMAAIAMIWPVGLAVLAMYGVMSIGAWLVRPRPKPDPDAELRELDETFAAELGIETTNPRRER